ncbi:MAG TPA: alpha/beta hydrolase, partial [Cellulomonas sp.]
TADTVRALPAEGTAPGDVAAWWASLPSRTRRLLLARHDRLGDLDGLPAAVRDRVNRRRLAAALTLAELECEAAEDAMEGLPGGSPQEMASERLAQAEALRDMLRAVRDVVDAGPDRYLLLLDTTMPGRAAVAMGDVDTADHVAVLVPGMTARVTPYLPGLVMDARVLRRNGELALRLRDRTGTVAAIAWIGYTAPLLTDVWSSSRAEAGAPALAATVQGIRASRTQAGAPAHLTVLAHSYGTHVAGLAAQQTTAIDDLVVMGSPGIGVDSAGETSVPTGHVYVTEATQDPVADADWFGADPQSRAFGAVPLQSDGGAHPLADETTLPSSGHSEYYLPDSESLWNISAVTVGLPQDTTRGSNYGAGDVVRVTAVPPWFR